MAGNGKIRRVVDERARPECPSCGANDWDFPRDSNKVPVGIVLPITDPDGTIRRDVGLPAVAYVCNHCGFIRAHSTVVLEDVEGTDH